MSYILDALRRADAERERGVVPGLHSNATTPEVEPATRDRRPLWMAIGGGGVVAVGLAVLLLGPWRAAPLAAAPDGATARSASADEANDAVAAQRAAAPMPEPSADAGRLAEPSRSVDRPAPRPVRRDEPAPAPVAAPRPAPAVTPLRGGDRTTAGSNAPATQANVEHYGAALDATPPQSRPPTPATAGVPVPAPAQPIANAAPTAPPTIKKFEDLPADVRASLPRLAVGGAIYSDTPSARMLILNGQVWHEGEHPTPDTVLEKIKLKSAVIDYRGTRYEISF